MTDAWVGYHGGLIPPHTIICRATTSDLKAILNYPDCRASISRHPAMARAVRLEVGGGAEEYISAAPIKLERVR